MGFIFHILQVYSDQNIPLVTSVDAVSFLGYLTSRDAGGARPESSHLFLFFLAPLEIQSAYDNHRPLIQAQEETRTSAKGF